tara:strand:+ start:504 stop:1160 length:657 start_codon:yes stop_codon:yes gene_type:complete
MSEKFEYKRMDRRSAINWMFAATATVHFLNSKALGLGFNWEDVNKGYGLDPNLMTPEVPWERIMTPKQLRTTAKLADITLPRTSVESPSATEVGVPDFFDEWISAPYHAHQEDNKVITEGLAWIDEESQRRFGKDFHELEEADYTAICNDIAYLPDALPEFEEGAKFFSKFRSLTMGGYYSTNVGTKDIGYVGNAALLTFGGPPREVLKRLGIDKAPW